MGVQQGDPLGPLLFSLVVIKLLDSVRCEDGVGHLWYLDDGTLIGGRTQVLQYYQDIVSLGPSLGLHLNPGKCEIYWPSGDQSFSRFSEDIVRLRDGVSILGSPLFGTPSYMASKVADVVEKVGCLQEKLLLLEDPQVELHLLRSCLSVCKVNHLLQTVPHYNT